MLQRAIFSLCLLTDDDQIQVIVSGAVTWQAVYMNHIGKQVQLSPVTKANNQPEYKQVRHSCQM